MVAATIDKLERVDALLWRTLLEFENLAQDQYWAFAPELLCPSKTALVEALDARAGTENLLNASAIGGPIDRVLDLAAGPDRETTLHVQGLLLEPLGQVIYGLTAENPAMSVEAREVARAGFDACADVIARVPSLLAKEGDALLQAFQAATSEVIGELDTLGEGVDDEFSESLNLHFSDIMGDFVADLLERCTDLGMPRRQLMVFLTAQMMGT